MRYQPTAGNFGTNLGYRHPHQLLAPQDLDVTRSSGPLAGTSNQMKQLAVTVSQLEQSCHPAVPTRKLMKVMLACSGDPLMHDVVPMSLSVDAMHSIRDVEASLRYHMTKRVHVTKPTYVLPSDRVLLLCAMAGKNVRFDT